MKWHQKLAVVTILSAPLTIGLGAVIFNHAYLQSAINREARDYTFRNLESLMAHQERKLKLKHRGTPRLTFDYDESWGNNEFLGEYTPDNDTINIKLGFVRAPTWSLNNIIFRMFNDDYDIRAILYHELGHFYQDRLREEFEIKKRKIDRIEDVVAGQLVEEGIAEYFSRKTLEKEEIEEDDLEESLKTFWPDYNFVNLFNLARGDNKFLPIKKLVEAGYYTVKPIIDKYGEMGVLYLIENPPPENTFKGNIFKNLTYYRTVVLSKLAEAT